MHSITNIIVMKYISGNLIVLLDFLYFTKVNGCRIKRDNAGSLESTFDYSCSSPPLYAMFPCDRETTSGYHRFGTT